MNATGVGLPRSTESVLCIHAGLRQHSTAHLLYHVRFSCYHDNRLVKAEQPFDCVLAFNKGSPRMIHACNWPCNTVGSLTKSRCSTVTTWHNTSANHSLAPAGSNPTQHINTKPCQRL